VKEEDLVGRVIDARYRVEARIGRGGMGAVYRVRHTQSHESFALKVLHPQYAADAAMVERFVREARAAAAFRSKHVVKIIDAQRDHKGHDGAPMPYLVMELLVGANLEAIVAARGPLPKEQVSWTLRQVGKALDLAHARGIVHRDLKPENLFVAVDEEGEPITKVCDFGIAKLVGEAALGLLTTGAMSTSASSLGTPMYMSPEQLRDASTVDAKTDQWAVGLIVYKALAGKEYFAAARSSGELMARILADPIVPPSKNGLDLGEAFDAWFLRSCDRNPEARWPSVSAQVAAFDEALGITAPAPIPAPAPGPNDVESAATGVLPVADTPMPISPTGAPSATTASRAEPRAKRSPLVWIAPAIIALLGISAYAMTRAPSPPTSSSTLPLPAPTPIPIPIPASQPAPSESAIPVAATAPPSASIAAAVVASAPAPIKTPGKTKPPVPSASAPPPPPTASAPAPKSKLASGAPCTRGAECASGYCFAEQCQ
jgi:serine/threonine-protein kinase